MPNVINLFLIALFLILVSGVKFAGFRQSAIHEDYIDLSVAKGVQGMMALLIMTHHLTQTASNFAQKDLGPITVFNDCGVLFTGVFLFFSGYGLYLSYKTKPGYLKTFFRKRFSKIVIPFYVCSLAFLIIDLLTNDTQGFLKADVSLKIKYLTGIVLFNNHMWYIVVIAILYLAFYLLFRFIKKDWLSFPLMAIFIAGLTAFSLFQGHDTTTPSAGTWFKGEWWYNELWLFFIGMLYAKFRKPIEAFCKKTYYVIAPVGIAGFILLFIWSRKVAGEFGYWTEHGNYMGYMDKFKTYLAALPASIVFVLTLVIIMMKFKFSNKALDFLGRISLELYLSHRIFLLFCNVNNTFMYYFATFMGSITLAAILHAVDTKLINLIISGKKNKSVDRDVQISK